MIQYVILEELGILSENDIKAYCTSEGILGCHPDYENPGITASTGALGHGLSMALGIAYSRNSKKDSGKVFCVVSDGELQEGSTWEAILMASSLKVNNLVLFIDNNDFQSLGRTSQTHLASILLNKNWRHLVGKLLKLTAILFLTWLVL